MPSLQTTVNESAEARVLTAIARIVQLKREAALTFALGVGEVVVEEILGGDLAQLQKRGPKEVSMRHLAEHSMLPITARALYAAVGIYELFRRLQEDVRTSSHLDYSHYEAVLPAPRDDQSKLLLDASRNGWSVRQLREVVASIEKRRRGGRRPTSELMRSVRAVTTESTRLKTAIAAAPPLADVDASHLKDLSSRLRELLAILDQRIDSAERAMSSLSSMGQTSSPPAGAHEFEERRPELPSRPRGAGVQLLG